MTEDNDLAIIKLFEDARQDLPGEEFTALVRMKTEQQKQKANIGWICLELALILCAWLLAAPLHDIAMVMADGLTVSLFELDNHLLAEILFPVNNVSSLVALGFIVLRFAYKKIFS